MLTLYHEGNEYPLEQTDYYVRQLASGLDEVIFDIPIYDPNYLRLAEEESIVDRGEQRYLVKQIDAGASSAKVVCQLDLDAWKATMHVGYTNGSASVYNTINGVKPSGWVVYDLSNINKRRTIKGDYTPLEICQRCTEVYGVYVRWDTALRTCTILSQAVGSPQGSFATRELNLKEINYKGKSNDFATRIYPYGKDGLTLEGATIDGRTYTTPYVDDNSYANKTVSVYWKDERYTDAQSLYDDAKSKLKKLAVPDRSYDCSIVDLKATNPELYGNLNFGLFTVATLIDDTKGTAVNYQVVERHEYPYCPELNEVIFDSSPLKITGSIQALSDELDDVSGELLTEFQAEMEREIDLATSWLTNADSHIYIKRDTDGNWQELYFIDGTQDIATATRVMRLNSSGLGFSKTGVNGTYTNAFVYDPDLGGHIVADFITAGTMSANRVRTGKLQSADGKVKVILGDSSTAGRLEITSGNLQLDANGNLTVTGEVNAQSGKIGNFTIDSNSIYTGTKGSGIPEGGDTPASGAITLSSANFARLINGTSRTCRFAIGPNFGIHPNGTMYASNVNIVGTITANTGYIGGTSGFTVASGKLYSGKKTLASGTSGVYLGTDGFSLGSHGSTGKKKPIMWYTQSTDILRVVSLRFVQTTNSSPYYEDAHDIIVDNQNRLFTGGGWNIGSNGAANPPGGEYDSVIYNTLYCNNVSPYSDKRQKRDIVEISAEDAKAFVMALRPVSFRYKDGGLSDSSEYHHGMIAQEVREAVRDKWNIVTGSDDTVLGLKYTEMIADLVKVAQEQEKKIAELEERIAALEAKA